MNNMKIATIILLVLVLGLVVTGCEKKPSSTSNNNPANTPAKNTAADITIDAPTGNPDIGMLDNVSVSDAIPQ